MKVHGSNYFVEIEITDKRIPESLKNIFLSRQHGMIQNDIVIMQSPFHNYWIDTQTKEVQDFILTIFEGSGADTHWDFECITWFPRKHSTFIRFYYWNTSGSD